MADDKTENNSSQQQQAFSGRFGFRNVPPFSANNCVPLAMSCSRLSTINWEIANRVRIPHRLRGKRTSGNTQQGNAATQTKWGNAFTRIEGKETSNHESHSTAEPQPKREKEKTGLRELRELKRGSSTTNHTNHTKRQQWRWKSNHGWRRMNTDSENSFLCPFLCCLCVLLLNVFSSRFLCPSREATSLNSGGRSGKTKRVYADCAN